MCRYTLYEYDCCNAEQTIEQCNLRTMINTLPDYLRDPSNAERCPAERIFVRRTGPCQHHAMIVTKREDAKPFPDQTDIQVKREDDPPQATMAEPDTGAEEFDLLHNEDNEFLVIECPVVNEELLQRERDEWWDRQEDNNPFRDHTEEDMEAYRDEQYTRLAAEEAEYLRQRQAQKEERKARKSMTWSQTVFGKKS